MLNELVRVASIGGAELFAVPFETLAATESDVPQECGFSQCSRISKVAGRGRAGFAGVNPFFMVADRFGNERIRAFEINKLFLRKQDVLVVVGQDFSLFADK